MAFEVPLLLAAAALALELADFCGVTEAAEAAEAIVDPARHLQIVPLFLRS